MSTKGILESLKLKRHCEMCGATNKKPKSVLEHHKDEFQLEPAFNPSGQPMTLCRDCRIGSAELLADRYAIGRANKLLEHIADFLEAFQSEDEHLSSPNGCAEGCEACAEEQSYFYAAKTVRALVDEREAGKYLVVSYDADQEQWHYDVIFASSDEAAKERILALRDYCVDADVINMADLAHMNKNVQSETIEESENWLAELADERDTNEDAKTESEEA